MTTSATKPRAGDPPDSEYEDLLGQWSDLEALACTLLARPADVQGLPAKLRQCDRWLADLVAHDIDAALYLMFQLATTSTVGYSGSHALVCAALCHILAGELSLPAHERASLVGAAFTMNIGMTALQDQLAAQREPLTPGQQQAVAQHPQAGCELLGRLGIGDALWLQVVALHHAPLPEQTPLAGLPPAQRLARVLGTIDRYAAMISPRKSRAGRSATDSVRAIVGEEGNGRDEVSHTLVRTVGLCPPGTFVRLDNGEAAVVLRRSERPNAPLVASVLDAHGEPLAAPQLYQTQGASSPRIQAALARSAVTLELNHRTMVRLGLYAAQRTHTL
ncbi:HD domain-containing phosphohydrolase [Pulveribacter sp.]|uniref:HD-GYP domain-containing protein n=1 Tax=Pulveribacter sp. TaxID=2678893 RepID=UPI0028AC6447|nr:HD domain-containing phosphohydrolase [Pulveribacter sp.]